MTNCYASVSSRGAFRSLCRRLQGPRTPQGFSARWAASPPPPPLGKDPSELRTSTSGPQSLGSGLLDSLRKARAVWLSALRSAHERGWAGGGPTEGPSSSRDWRGVPGRGRGSRASSTPGSGEGPERARTPQAAPGGWWGWGQVAGRVMDERPNPPPYSPSPQSPC